MYDPLWVTRDGRKLRAGQMDDDHLQRCIKKIEGSRGWRKEWLPRLYLEVEIRRMRYRGQM